MLDLDFAKMYISFICFFHFVCKCIDMVACCRLWVWLFPHLLEFWCKLKYLYFLVFFFVFYCILSYWKVLYVLTISHLLDIVDNVMMNVMCYVQPTVPTVPSLWSCWYSAHDWSIWVISICISSPLSILANRVSGSDGGQPIGRVARTCDNSFTVRWHHLLPSPVVPSVIICYHQSIVTFIEKHSNTVAW